MPVPCCTRQWTELNDDHDDEKHVETPIWAVELHSTMPKFSPVTVTASPSVVGAFIVLVEETTGESNE